MITYLLTHNSQECLDLKKKKKEGVREKERNTTVLF